MNRSALAAGLVAVGLWGLAPVATRAAVGHLPPLPMLIIRMSAASLVLLPWAWPVFRGLTPRQVATGTFNNPSTCCWRPSRSGSC